VSWYYEQHKQKNFNGSAWKCQILSNKDNIQEQTLPIPCEESEIVDTGGYASPGKVSQIFSTFLKRKINTCNAEDNANENDDTSDRGDELWDDITLEDLDLDLLTEKYTTEEISTVSTPNVSLAALLVWLCVFICTWQATNVTTDNAINNSLSFFSPPAC